MTRQALPLDKGELLRDGRKVTLLLTAALTIMAGATISPSLPGIEAAFVSSNRVELLSRLVLTLPALTVALCAPAIGPLSDRIGRRDLMIASIVLYALSGLSGLVLSSIYGLLIGRALLGAAVAGIMTLGTALAADYFSGPARDSYMGLQQACVGIGGLVFLAAGGGLAEIHWRAPFALYGLALLLVPAVIVYINDARPTRETHTVAAASSGEATAYLSVVALCLVAALNSVVFYLIPAQLPFYMRTLSLAAPTQSGWVMGLVPFFMAVSSMRYGRLSRYAQVGTLLACGFVLMAIGFWTIGAATSLAGIAAGTSIVGFGMGFVMPSMMSTSMTLAAPETRGTVAGLLTASIFIGQFISPLASQPWIGRSGYAQTFQDAGLLLLLVATASWILRGHVKRPPAASVS